LIGLISWREFLFLLVVNNQKIVHYRGKGGQRGQRRKEKVGAALPKRQN